MGWFKLNTRMKVDPYWWYPVSELGIDVKWEGKDPAVVALMDRSGDLHLDMYVDPGSRGFFRVRSPGDDGFFPPATPHPLE